MKATKVDLKPIVQDFATQERLLELGIDPLRTARGVGRHGRLLRVRTFLGNRFVCFDQDNETSLLTDKQVQRWFA